MSYQNNPDLFPELNLVRLESIACKWAKYFTSINQITLYDAPLVGFNLSVSYVLFFKLDELNLYDWMYKLYQSAFNLETREGIQEYIELPSNAAWEKTLRGGGDTAFLGLGCTPKQFKEKAYRDYSHLNDHFFESWAFVTELPENIDDKHKWILFMRDEINADSKNKSKTPSVFPCKPGTRWEDIKITLTGPDTVRIKTPLGENRYSYHELGMSDKRAADRPTRLWGMLKILLENDGKITTENYDQKIPDTIKALNKHLKKLFGINENVFPHYRKSKSYTSKIFMSDQTREIR